MNNWILRLLQTEAGKRLQLQLLMNLAAKATGQKSRCISVMSSDKALDTFAHFTAGCLPKATGQQKQLYTEAYKLGSLLRKILRISTDEQLTRTVILLYRNIGIDMQGDLPGEVCVSHCFFSRYYSPEVCSIASMMDAGVICGLANGGKLEFTQRITEGCKNCKAKLIK